MKHHDILDGAKALFTRPRLNNWLPLCAAGALLIGTPTTRAVNYSGNGNTGFGGTIGNGVLSLTDDGTNISGTLTVGASMNDVLVIYIQTGAGSSFAGTSGFADAGDGLRTAISGYNGTQRSLMTFTNGFRPNYAVALGPSSDSFGGIWGLANGGNNSLNYSNSANLSPTGTGTGPFTFSFGCTNIGLTPGVGATIQIFGTYISHTAYRSTEAIAGNDTGVQGWNPFTQTALAAYTFDAGASETYPVTFSVDMSVQIAGGYVFPDNGDTVYVAGSFQNPAFAGVQLTPTVANTNIYTGTIQDSNTLGTAEIYKFRYHSVSGNSDFYENGDNRPFTLQSGGQNLPVVYFGNLTPGTGTNLVTFVIDMTPIVQEDRFNPASGDQIEVFGTFEYPAHWNVGDALVLTNNPNAANTNIYSGTYADGNYPGTWNEYKFVIVNGANDNYESTPNRIYYSGVQTLPLAYFNNISNVVAIPVSFSVDMSSQIYAGNVNPANGDTVGVIGSWEGPNAYAPRQLILANNPNGLNTNLFTGNFTVIDQPHAFEQYKFVINTNGGGTDYEQPVSTGGNNRSFTLASSAQVLPTVFWSDLDPHNVLPAPMSVIFTVNMNNAVDDNGNPFVPSTDDVFVFGDWMQGGFANGGTAWTNANVDTAYSQFKLNENPIGSGFYQSQALTIPGGNSLQLTYKYGIYHNVQPSGNTNCDNEAGFAINHTRWIRALGNYNFPTDIFGASRTNYPASVTEQSFGDLAPGQPAGGHILISWLGRPGVHLQTRTNLTTAPWEDHPETDAYMSTNWPFAGRSRYFRLINP